MRERKLFVRRDLWLLALLALGILLAFFLPLLRPAGTALVVERSGQQVLRRELSDVTGEETLTVEGENGIVLTLTLFSDGAAVTEAGCPDKICVQTGKLTRAGETAVCLPARVSVRLEGGGGPDAETF